MMDARRLAMLEAMGVEVLALRTLSDAHAHENARAVDVVAAETAPASKSASVDSAVVCMVCRHGVRKDARLARLFVQIARALALAPAAIDWLEADTAGTLPAPREVAAYLVLGAAIAPAMGAQLSTAQQNAAVIAVSADIADLPGGAAGKRALWQVLKPIARRLAAERA